MKEAKEYLKKKGITPLTKHHNYKYLYRSVIDAIMEAQIDAFTEAYEQCNRILDEEQNKLETNN
jgi:hypothetical protein